jgi:hypothetical protein
VGSAARHYYEMAHLDRTELLADDLIAFFDSPAVSG